jgi:hypothetical protein
MIKGRGTIRVRYGRQKVTTSLRELSQRLARFAKERDWDQYHSPKNLAMALSVEVAEF